MSDVFISYSRRDIDFVRHLFDQLTARDREPWADWQDISPTAEMYGQKYRTLRNNSLIKLRQAAIEKG